MLDPAFVSYVAVMSITPGPNNLMLASSGVNFGFKRTLPMVLGIGIGCAVQLTLTLLLLAFILNWVAVIRFPLAVIGCTYLLWMSWQLFSMTSPQAKQHIQPMSVLGIAFFQGVNPKAWIMVINVALLFTPQTGVMLSQIWPLVIGFAAVNTPCILIWVMMGDRLRQVLQVSWKLRLFNGSMAGLMACTALWLLFDEWSVAFA